MHDEPPADAIPTVANLDEWKAVYTSHDITPGDMDGFAKAYMPFIDYHIHLRGGMTAEKAVARQAITGMNSGVLRNIGDTWPIETDEQLREFLDSVEGLPVFVGVQVNDRDWYQVHDRELLDRLDYVLADTMIMPNEKGTPTRLWMEDTYEIDDVDAWMERYMKHNLRVLAEPVDILANPTYLPSRIEDQYDRLWTKERMLKVIDAAIANNVAFEINATRGYPHDSFIELAKEKGAKFTVGSNNFDDTPLGMSRCVDVMQRLGLKKKDMFVPEPKQ